MPIIRVPKDTSEINIDGTVYKPINGVIEVQAAAHIAILTSPAHGFVLLAEGEEPAPLPEPTANICDQFPKIYDLLNSYGVALADTATAQDVLNALEAAMPSLEQADTSHFDSDNEEGANQTTAPVVAKELTPTEKVKAELDALNVEYAKNASLNVLKGILEANKPKQD